ncbi:uncharacterized protein BX664DRAFT_324567 [Halteromyces radiatus]|uniref:uncharacterized protein n=1 Tax=Halteromyces radiatus TaxID=101107 RepID=UPI00221FA5B1|nr:uncharacterized protein BX664DRAFT_324567 [Halteromyces radiatus]KAI8096667.1 hypothetical protein BX664DRAFT_324567 [Halteromyces radiatus]
MHLSDFTYLERCTIYVYAIFYFFYSIWKSDGFQCLRLKKILSGELKSVLTVLMMLTMTAQVVWDLTFTYIKYNEGYMELNGQAIIKPYQYWSPQNQQLALAVNYIEAAAYSLQTSLYVMLQCFWNYLSNSVANKDFMGSFEFKFYIVWSILSMAMFPILQWYYHYDPIKEEVIPQFAYAGEVFITALLGIRTFLRFRRIIQHGRETNANPLVINKMKYFMDINSLMTACLFSYSISFLIMCIDGMTDAKVIATNKFAVDCILANINITVLFLYILFIAVFHPRKLYGMSNSVTNPSSGQPSNNFNSKSINMDTKDTSMDMEETTTAMASAPVRARHDRIGSHKRFSQRVTSFIGQKFQQRMMDAPTDSFQQTFEKNEYHLDNMSNDIITNPPTLSSSNTTAPSSSVSQRARGYYESKTFMRPMSPVSVDYPSPSMTGDTVPLTIPPSPQHPPSPYGSSSFLLQQQRYPLSTPHDRHHQRRASNDSVLDLPSSPPQTLEQSDWLRRSPDRRNH